MRHLLLNFIARLSVARKLILIYALDLSAVIFVSTILINEKFIAIDFARKEIVGNEYIGALRAATLVALAGGGLRGAADAVLEAEARHGSARGDLGSGELAQALADKLRRLETAGARTAADEHAGRVGGAGADHAHRQSIEPDPRSRPRQLLHDVAGRPALPGALRPDRPHSRPGADCRRCGSRQTGA
jgi:hypothetical protein